LAEEFKCSSTLAGTSLRIAAAVPFSMPTAVLVPTMGAALIGVFTSVFLYGITTLQTFLYYERFWHEDRREVKYTVRIIFP
jgi:hypothetical protein